MDVPAVILLSHFAALWLRFSKRNLRPGAITMSRTFRSLALSAVLLAATTGSAFASGPGGTIPPPQGSFTSYVLVALSVFGF
jgi:hypothetical protein